MSDVEAWWRRLGSAALVGTARRPAPSVEELSLPGPGVRARPSARPEEVALDAAAVGGTLRRAGRRASTGPAVGAEAPAERLPEAPVRAQQLLELLLTQSPADAGGTDLLLLHWCTVCREAGARVPPRLLPALLDRATSGELRERVADVVGERGGWLAAQNPAWSWCGRAAGASGDPGPAPPLDPRAWALEGSDRRLQLLRQLRGTDPAAARELLLTTWATDAARDRRALLEALLVNLGPGDEELLEAALDDRSAAVRDLAAELLDALPGSRRAARMAERLRPLVRESGRLRRHLEVALPDDPDAAGRRDGLGRPPAGRSARGWWLERIVAGAPFEAWDGPPDTVVPRIRDTDVLAGLRRAAALRRAPDWARALLDHPSHDLAQELLAVLPEREREARVVDELARAPHTRVAELVAHLPATWSPPASAAVLARLDRLRPAEAGVVVGAVLPHLARGLHPDAVPALQRWRARADLGRRQDDRIGSVIQSRTLRHTISEAFQ